jgi:cell wall assembly regulator SMI1
MQKDTWDHIEAHFARYEELCRAQGPAVSDDEVDAAAAALGVHLPTDYREFLLRAGGGVIGPYDIYGLRPVAAMGNEWNVVEQNQYWRDQEWPSVQGCLIISMDSRGNPIGIAPDGSVHVSDHDAGCEAVWVADTFEAFIRQKGLGLPS